MSEEIVLPEELMLTPPVQLPQSRTYVREFPAARGQTFHEEDVVEFRIPPSDRCYLGKNTYLKFDIHAEYFPGGYKDPHEPASVTWPYDYTDPKHAGEAYYNTAVLSFDKCGALGCIDQIQVYDYEGVSLLENISGHGQLQCLFRDIDTPLFYNQYAGSCSGCAKPYVQPSYDVYSNVYNTQLAGCVTEPRCGDSFFQPMNKNWLNEDGVYDYPYNTTLYSIKSVVIPLFSFLGVLSEQMVPLHNGFTIRIRLSRNDDAFVFATPLGTLKSSFFYETATTPKKTDTMDIEHNTDSLFSSNAFIREGFPQYKQMTLVCDYYELSPGAESIVRSSLSGNEMVIHSKSYRHSNFYVGNQTREISHILNSDLASVRNFYWFMRPFEITKPVASFMPNPSLNLGWYTGTYTSSDSTSKEYRIHPSFKVTSLSTCSLSNRIRNGLVRWWLKIDNEMIPSHKGIEAGPDSKDIISYTGVDPNEDENTPTNLVIADRSCDSLYQLLKTRDFKKSIYNTLIDKYSYEITDSIGLGYPIEAVNQQTIGNTLNNDLQKYIANPVRSLHGQHGKFAGGYNLQARPFSQMGVATGTDLRGKVTRLEARFEEGSQLDPNKAIVDTYLEFDSYIKIIPNVLTTVSF